MSNFCLTSKDFLINKYKETKEKAGYAVSGSVENNQFNYLSFHKFSFKNENFLSIGEDFVGVVGTLIYKDSIVDILKKLYDDWDDDITKIRRNSIGSYCIIIKKGSFITVFGEENYMFNIYYYLKNKTYILSNSFFDVKTIYNQELEIDEFNLLEQSFNTYVLGNESIYKDVKRLCGDEYIQIDIIKNEALVNRINVDWSFNTGKSYQERINIFSDNLIKKVRITYNAFGTPALCMTGGLDSRLCLAPVLANEIKPDLFYGVGNSILTDTKDMDLKINQMYVDKFGLSLKTMDWSTPLPIDKDWQKYFDRYAESFVQYNASSCFLESLENIPNHYLTFGYFGEMFRNIPWIENLNKEIFTIDEYLDDYMLSTANFNSLIRSTNISYNDFREHIKNKLIKLCDRYNINPQRISVDEYRYIFLEYIRLGHSIMLNLVNKMKYIYFPIAEDDIYKYSSISRKENLGAKFMLDVYNQIYQPVLEIPFYSHSEIRYYNKKKGVLDPPASVSISKITKYTRPITRLLPKTLRLWLFRTIVTKDTKASKDELVNHDIDDVIDKFVRPSKINNLEFKPSTQRQYVNLAMMIFAVQRVNQI